MWCSDDEDSSGVIKKRKPLMSKRNLHNDIIDFEEKSYKGDLVLMVCLNHAPQKHFQPCIHRSVGLIISHPF